MPFTVQDLLLTDEREAQLTSALANLGVSDPLGDCITEASAEVDRYCAGYVLAEAATKGFVRALALHRAFMAAQLGIPDDIQKGYDAAVKELTAIAKGERPNLPLAEPATPDATGALFGSATRFDPLGLA